MSRDHRGTIYLEEARVISQLGYPGEQFILRAAAPECAARALPGQFVHLRCDPDIPMRRPLSVMRADPDAGWIEVLYKPIGQGLAALERLQAGDSLSLLGPIGRGFSLDDEHACCVLVGGGVGIPPLLFLAETIARQRNGQAAIAFFGSELPFPFETCASALELESPADATDSLALLENWRIPGRLASGANLPGCHRGLVTALARHWLATRSATQLQNCRIYSCGPTQMLKAVQSLAAEYSLPTQLCLEEYMACAVGGCAGCTVEVQEANGAAMRRVCVDGPVFDGYTVYA